MNDKQVKQGSGSYTANLLGNIRSHLAGLQGYDVMALELIQNADDARAEEIIFDITDDGLLVRNSGKFTYCGDLDNSCGFLAGSNYKCDYHRIIDVGSGGKLSRGENIGRFGIGFVSTYQVTDQPEICSSGIKLTLRPELGQWSTERYEESYGTSFFLPWATNPESEARLELGVSHVRPDHIDQLAEEFQGVLRESLLFLRHVRKAEVRRNGQLLFACDLDRGEDSELIVSFRPSDEVEQWHILRTDATKAARSLYEIHPRLESLERSTNISIGLRIEPKPLKDGLLYAFLPTEQSTGLPLHINADFFPESDRKAVIFTGHQHEQAWNEMLIGAAAAEIARDPECLMQTLGHVPLWQILGQAYKLSSEQTDHPPPPCYGKFWEHLKSTATQAQIAPAQDGSIQRPGGVFLTNSPFTERQAKAFFDVGGRLATEDLRSFRNAMIQLGAQDLTLERLVGLMESAMSQQATGASEVDENKLEQFYKPLWNIVNDLLPENSSSNRFVERLQAVPFLVTEDLFIVTIDQTYTVLVLRTLDAARIAELLPKLAIANSLLSEYPKITKLIKPLDLGVIVSHITSTSDAESVEEAIAVDQKDLKDLYTLFADLDRQNTVEQEVYQQLRDLPIWQSSRGLVSATQVLLPGDFSDPTGQAKLLDTSVLTESAREFLTSKLEVRTQTIEAFVQTVLPTFFDDDGPLDETKFTQLINDLSNHSALVDNEDIRQSLGSLRIAPTQDGGWSCPVNTYRKTDHLVKVLGDTPHLWLDGSRIPDTRSVNSFIDSLGIRSSPNARHLVDRMLFIAKEYLPTKDSKKASSETFYVLCDKYEEWREKKAFLDAIADLQEFDCFPAIDDSEQWHSANSLHAPYRAEAFESQTKILDFRTMTRLNRDLLKYLGIVLEPKTQLVINHLRHCVSLDKPAPYTTYQILNERAKDEESLIGKLAKESFIFIEGQQSYVRTNQLFWVSQQLGRYAYTIPGNYELFKPLFDIIGVKNAPDGNDYIDIALDIIDEYFKQSKPLAGQDRAVYDACLKNIASAYEQKELQSYELDRLKEAPTVLNLQNQLAHPDEVLLKNSEWHAGFFGGELEQALCKPAPELWPLLEDIGTRRLSESAQVELEFVDGQKKDEGLLAERLMDRMDILSRLLHDKPKTVRKKVRDALSGLTAVSYDTVHIQASVYVGGDQAFAPPTPAHAYYDIENKKLILERPARDQRWSHILNAFLHQLMPEESGSEISKLTLSIRPLMTMEVEEAHDELSEAGIPSLDAETGAPEDLTSPELDEMGSATTPPDQTSDEGETDSGDHVRDQQTEGSGYISGITQSDRKGRAAYPGGSRQGHTERSGSGTSEEARKGAGQDRRRPKKSRPKHKAQWDRRLLSYVRQKQEDASNDGEQADLTKHNLAVEAVARDAVCAYEKERGRIAEQMAQTYPGYDIISHNPETKEDRYIEVKGVNGEWNQTGVGLSRLQFSNAQDYGGRYWLYVVEFVSDSEHICVHPIQSPATQVTTFMFDGNWRQAVREEPPNPSAQFVAGARIHHQGMGSGEIQEVVTRGNTKLLTIQFDGKSQVTRNVTLNLYRMRILEATDDDNDS